MELRGLDATRRLAESVATVLRPGDVIGLDGDLGAGKTTFVRFLARALGVTTPVTSPTFTLANIYEAPGRPTPAEPAAEPAVSAPAAGSPLLIHHIDAYRLDGDADAEDLALGELLDSGGIVVVEWAERLTLPPDRLDIHFAYPPEPAADPPAADAEPVADSEPAGAAPAVPSPEPPDAPASASAPPNPSGTPPAVHAERIPPGVAGATAALAVSEPAVAAAPPVGAAAATDLSGAPATAPAPTSAGHQVRLLDATDHRVVTITPHGPNWQARPIRDKPARP